MDIRIIRAGHGECVRVAPLFDAYRQYYQQPADLDRALDFIGQRLAREESAIFLASQNGADVGFVQLFPIFSSVRTSIVWLLNDLFVVAQARRQGVARSLLLAARKHAIKSKASGLVLETLPENLPAQALYRELGWELDGNLHYQLETADSA